MENQPTKQSLISEEMEITGTVKTSGSLRVDGKIDGELSCGGDVVIGKGAQVKANLSANSISVEGNVTGNITVKDKIDMKSSARVMGDVRAKRLSVEDGVTFVGKSEVNPSGSSASKAPAEDEQKDSTTSSQEQGGASASLLSGGERTSPFSKRK